VFNCFHLIKSNASENRQYVVPLWVRRGAEQSEYRHRRKLVSGKTALGNIDQHCRDWAVKLLIPQPNGLLTRDSRSIGTTFGFFREPMQNAELVPGSQVFQLPAVRRGCARLSRTKPARTPAPRASPAFLYFGSWIHFFCRSVIHALASPPSLKQSSADEHQLDLAAFSPSSSRRPIRSPRDSPKAVTRETY
jgi:hypothetical protein